MPWTTLTEPSLGLGILKQVLTDAGIDCRVRHLNLFLLRHLQASTYFSLANVFALNDFLFSGVIEPDISSRQRILLRGKARELLEMSLLDEREVGGVDGVVRTLLDFRQRIIPAWLRECARTVLDDRPTLVGLTCMFDQTIASVALARLIREQDPGVTIALGGYAVRSPTAETVLEAFPYVDAVCLGDGEPAIELLARASVGELALSDVPGVLCRQPDGTLSAAPAGRIGMDEIPVPDYGDYFADLEELADTEQVEVSVGKLPVENSRGCWWGAVSHCVFCGIHDDDLAYRAKSAATALKTMHVLAERHGVSRFRFADYILPREYFQTLLPELAALDAPYDITSEIKANLSPRMFDSLRAAGFTELQPGIESFSTRALRQMAKGTSRLHNVQTLVLGARHGITIHYNLLYGFPDDSAEDYAELLELLPALFHLDPPSTRLEVQVTRYAPLQVDPTRFGIPTAAYEPSYQLIFSADWLARTGFDLSRYAYYFQRPFENAPRLRGIYAAIDATVDRWRAVRRERHVELRWVRDADGTEVLDSRSTAEVVRTRLSTVQGEVLLRCSTVRSRRQLRDELATAAASTVDAAVDDLLARRFLVADGDRVVSLVLAETDPFPSGPLPGGVS